MTKTVLVTGASRGIGKAISKAFLDVGYKVYGISKTDKNIEWTKEFNDYIPLIGNISDENFIHETILKIKKNNKTLDILINCAAIEKNSLIGMIEYKDIIEMFEVNVFPIILLIQKSSRIMKEGSVIINISSNVGIKGNPGQLVYSATKGAVDSITKTSAKELGKRGIRVNSVVPGLTNTEMLNDTEKKYLFQRTSNIILGKIIEPVDVSNLVYFLTSDKASMITGQVIPVDGLTIM